MAEPGASLRKVTNGSNTGPKKRFACSSRYGLGPNATLCVSIQCADIVNVTLSAALTVLLGGKNAIDATPLASLPARTTLPCGPLYFRSRLASFVLARSWRLTRAASAFLAERAFFFTLTVSVTPGCSAERSTNVPAFGNFTTHGSGGPSSARPLPTTFEPSMTSPPCGMIAAGLGAKAGWPLNHMSLPAASLAPETGASGLGAANAEAFVPFGRKIVSPKPSVVSLILSPLAIVTRSG